MPGKFTLAVHELLSRNKIYYPARDFIKNLSLELSTPEDLEQFKTLIKDMVAVVKRERKHSNNRQLKHWLSEVARTLDDFQVLDRHWIEMNIGDLPGRQVRVAKVYDLEMITKDIRLASDPTLECYREDAASDVVASPETKFPADLEDEFEFKLEDTCIDEDDDILYATTRKTLEQYGIDIQKIAEMRKSQLKKMVKEKINEKLGKMIQKAAESMTKLRFMKGEILHII